MLRLQLPQMWQQMQMQNACCVRDEADEADEAETTTKCRKSTA